jgi:glycosyltransferase involved in cell wall biosynthesis
MQDRDIIFLNHYGLAVANKLPHDARLIALSSGSDIDVYCNAKAIWPNSFDIRRKWLWPASLALNMLRTIRQKTGLRRVSAIIYFPPGLNVVGDKIIKSELKNRPDVVFSPRFDVDFYSTGTRFEPVRSGGIKKILVPVRFNMSPNSGNKFEYKGNDIIIEALGRYIKRNNSAQIFLVNKGPQEDLSRARQLCDIHGISKQVVWLDQMPLMDLLDHYYESDVCIDQVGSHWMGAVGAYALFCGIPLIANWRPDVFEIVWGKDAPIMQAKSVEEIYAHLMKCENSSYRNDLSIRGHKFANDFLSAEATYNNILRVIGV